MHSPLHPELVPVSIISALAAIIPLPWHMRLGNAATIAMTAWLMLLNVIFAVDGILWGEDVNIKAKIWCDISTKLIIGANFALPAACLCICIHLEHMASGRQGQAMVANKSSRRLVELVMCFGLPLAFMGLHYIVQGHRFDIIEGFGCRPAIYFSVPALFIVWIPPLILAIASLVFAGKPVQEHRQGSLLIYTGALALRHFILRRLAFASLLDSSNSSLTTPSYLRLMFMSYLQMIWSISVTSYSLWFTCVNMDLRPWISWGDVHFDFGRIDRFPVIVTPPFVRTGLYIGWWVTPISTWVFVAFFAFGHDAVQEYKKCLVWIRSRFSRAVPSRSGKPDKDSSNFAQITKQSNDSSIPSLKSGLPAETCRVIDPSFGGANGFTHHSLRDAPSSSQHHLSMLAPSYRPTMGSLPPPRSKRHRVRRAKPLVEPVYLP